MQKTRINRQGKTQPRLQDPTKDRIIVRRDSGPPPAKTNAAPVAGPVSNEVLGTMLADLGGSQLLLRAEPEPTLGPKEQLIKIIGEPAEVLSQPRAVALNAFLAGYPNFWPNVQKQIKGIKFDDRLVGSREATFDAPVGGQPSGKIAVGKLLDKDPDQFVRLLIHETGHATLERFLSNGRDAPGSLLNGRFTVAQLNGTNRTNDSNLASARAFWVTMRPEGRALYEAWQTLRRDGGRYLLGLNLGGKLTPAQRQKYQADSFNEFVAESFMHYAKHDINRFVADLIRNSDIADDIRLAWGNAWRLIQSASDPILLTPQQ